MDALEDRVALHRALADVHRLMIVDELQVTDATPTHLRALTGLTSSLLSFHLDVLDRVGLVARHQSQGDARRRYVRLGPAGRAALAASPGSVAPDADRVLFVCTHNSARSQLASAMWTARTGRRSWSAGSRPADAVNPDAVAIAALHGLDLDHARPCGYADLHVEPDLVVSVCDRASEEGLPYDVPRLHWSIRAPRTPSDFRATWAELDRRLDRLARLAPSRLDKEHAS